MGLVYFFIYLIHVLPVLQEVCVVGAFFIP